VINSTYIFAKFLFTAVILPNVFHDLTRLLFWIFAANLVGFLYIIMSAGSPQYRVRQRTVEDRATLQAKTMDCTVIVERNVIRSNIMVPPLDSIHAIIDTYNWGYLHSCACVVYTRLVKLFYANLEVVQNDDRGLVLQSTVVGHIITIDPQVINHIIRVPVLEISASPYNEVVLSPSLDDLREFFHAFPQGEERPTSIRIGALSPSHRMLAKIIQQNIWHVAWRSDMILKRAQFVYVVHLRFPFYLCKHILGVMLEAGDEGNAGLPFGCLLTQIILQSGVNVTGEPKMNIQQPISNQTLMKSNTQLRRDDSDDEVSITATMPVGFPDMASSSQTIPPSEPEVNYSQIMEALTAIQGGMSAMQVTMVSMQQEIHSINLRVEQN